MSNILTNNINPRSGNKITIGGVNDRVSIAGTLTYEDVTSVDSVGVITSRNIIFSGSTGQRGQFVLRRDSDGANIGQFQSDSGTNDISIGNGGNGNLILKTGANTERLRINSTGNVGINSTNPAYLLDIASGNASMRLNSTSTSTFVITSGASNAARIEFGDLDNNDTGYIYYDNSDDSMQFATNGSNERMRIDSSGRLLVGTTSSSADTRVVIQGRSTAADSTGRLYLASGNNAPASGDGIAELYFSSNAHVASSRIAAQRDGGTWTAGSSLPTRLVFSTTADGASSPTDRMTIKNNGRINIVSNYTTGSPQVYVENGTSSSGQQGVQVKLSSSSDNTSSFIYIGSSNGNKFYVYGNGNVVNSNNSYGPISSDQRLKQDISDANSQWDDIKNIRITNFHYKNDPAGPLHLGPIAQELEQVSPGLITRRPVSDDEIVDPSNDLIDGDEVLSFKSSILYMKAVKALQEAMDRIETLEQRLTDAGL